MEVASKLDQVALLFIQTSFLRELGDYTALLIDLGKTHAHHFKAPSDSVRYQGQKQISFIYNKQTKKNSL